MSRSTALSTLVALLALTAAKTALAAVPSPAASAPGEVDATNCMSTAQVLPDFEHKGKTAAYVTNQCGTPVDMRICLKTEKDWDCGTVRNVSPQTTGSHSSSHATGQVFVAARPNGSNQTLNSPAE